MVGQFATFLESERQALIKGLRGPRRLLWLAMTGVAARYDRKGVRASRTILVLNSQMLHSCRQLGASDVRLVPPGVNTAFFRPPTHGSRSGLLCVGRLSDPRKQVELLVRAFYELLNTYGYPGRLILAGSTGPSTEVKELIDRLDLGSHIEVHEGISDQELLNLYQHAELFVLPSAEEGLGIVLLEALASGLPVVATATDGASEILTGQPWARLLPLSQAVPDRLASLLAERLGQPEHLERDAVLGREFVVDRYSDSRVRTQLEAALTEAARGATTTTTSGAAK